MGKQLYSIRVSKHTDTRFPYYSVFITKVVPIPYSMPVTWNLDDVLSAMSGYRLNGLSQISREFSILSMIVRLPHVKLLPET